MASNEQKAQQLISEAEKKLSGSKGFFGSLFGWVNLEQPVLSHDLDNNKNFSSSGSARVEDAVECYQRAAILFKMSKKWPEAGNAFSEAANLQAKAGSRHDAASNYVEAANCFKKADINGLYFVDNNIVFVLVTICLYLG